MQFLTVGLLLFAAGRPAAVEHATHDFRSGGEKIRVEHFTRGGTQKRPVIVLAPESASFARVGPVYRGIAARLAEDGYLVLIVHFFDRTGHDGVAKKDIEEKHFRKWMEALGDGVKYARGLADAEPGRIGLLGFSLGGYLAMAVAADPQTHVQAVGCYCGGLPAPLWPGLKQLPPLLVVHGTRDDVVPVSEAYALVGFCKEHGLACECKIYPVEGHLFKKALENYVLAQTLTSLAAGKRLDVGETLAAAVRQEPTVRGAVRQGLAFFAKHLK